MKDKIFFVGGVVGDTQEALSSVFMFDTSNDMWSTIPGMKCGRMGHAIAVRGHCLYVVGGRDRFQQSALFRYARHWKTVEIWNQASASWCLCPSLKFSRANHTATFIGNRLFSVGGSRSHAPGYDLEFHRSVEVLSKRDARMWKAAGPLNQGRDEHIAMTSSSGKLVVAGGGYCYGHRFDFWEIEVYDAVLNQWALTCPVVSPRVLSSYAVLDDMLYIAGGQNPEDCWDCPSIEDDWPQASACRMYEITACVQAEVPFYVENSRPGQLLATRRWMLRTD